MNLAQQKDEHIGELTLRRRRAGEALGPDGPAIEAHATSCADCRARIRALDDEQRRFEQEISFDRFAAGVERAARSASKAKARRPSLNTWVAPMLAMAACVVAMVTFVPRPVFQKPATRTKGGAGITVRVAGVDGQRNARVDATEPLARGERLRIGYQPGAHRYLLALSIDEHGVGARRCTPSRARAWRCPTARRARPATCPTAWSWTGGRRADHRRALRSADRRRGRASAPRAPPTTRRAATWRACPAWTCRASNSSRTFAKP